LLKLFSLAIDSLEKETAMKIGIIGYGNYGQLLHALIRRFALMVDVVIHDPLRTPDGRVFVHLDAMADCDAIIFAVPMNACENEVQNVLLIPNLRTDTVFVNVCSEQEKSGEMFSALAGAHPCIYVHSPWGPEAYRLVDEVVSKLPAIVVTKSTLAVHVHEQLLRYVRHFGFKLTHMKPHEHDQTLAGRQMYITHMNSQILQIMGMLDSDCSSAPLSFQDLVRSATTVRHDEKLFFDLWHRVPECQKTFEGFVAAVHELERRKNLHVNGK
jgi:prephenate dehydrogenase